MHMPSFGLRKVGQPLAGWGAGIKGYTPEVQSYSKTTHFSDPRVVVIVSSDGGILWILLFFFRPAIIPPEV